MKLQEKKFHRKFHIRPQALHHSSLIFYRLAPKYLKDLKLKLCKNTVVGILYFDKLEHILCKNDAT